jgi:hypothetical protein
MNATMTMAIGTGLEPNLLKECRLVRAAMLYGDRAVVYSPFLALLRSTANIRNFSTSQFYKLTMKIAPHIVGPDVLSELPTQVLQHLQGRPSPDAEDLSANDRALLQQIEALLKQNLEKLVALAHANDSVVGMSDLIFAEREGLLDIHGFQLPSEGEALVEHMSRVLESFSTKNGEILLPEAFHFLTGYVRLALSGETYPVLDPGVTNLLSPMIAEMGISAETTARASHGQLSAIILGHLPLPQAPMEEILELRTTLQPYVPAFRGRLAEFALQIGQQPWTPDFQRAAERLFMERVEPEIEVIRTLVKKRLTKKNVGTAVAATGMGVSLAPLLDIREIILACLGITIGAAASIGTQWAAREEEAERNAMFFYHAAEISLLSK